MLMMMAERVDHMPGIRSGKDYLFHLTKAMLSSGLPFELIGESHPTDIGGGGFHRADFTADVDGATIRQTFLAAKRGEFVLGVVLVAGTKAQMARLEEMASSIRLSSD
jgi:hypothetical protein